MTLSASLKFHTWIFYEKTGILQPPSVSKSHKNSKFFWLGSEEGRWRLEKWEETRFHLISELVFSSAIPKKLFLLFGAIQINLNIFVKTNFVIFPKCSPFLDLPSFCLFRGSRFPHLSHPTSPCSLLSHSHSSVSVKIAIPSSLPIFTDENYRRNFSVDFFCENRSYLSFPLSSHLTPISAANGRLRRLRHSPRDGSTKGASSHKSSTVTTPPNGTEPATRRPKP